MHTRVDATQDTDTHTCSFACLHARIQAGTYTLTSVCALRLQEDAYLVGVFTEMFADMGWEAGGAEQQEERAIEAYALALSSAASDPAAAGLGGECGDGSLPLIDLNHVLGAQGVKGRMEGAGVGHGQVLPTRVRDSIALLAEHCDADLVRAMAHLPVSLIQKLPLLSRRFHALCSNDGLWKALYDRDFAQKKESAAAVGGDIGSGSAKRDARSCKEAYLLEARNGEGEEEGSASRGASVTGRTSLPVMTGAAAAPASSNGPVARGDFHGFSLGGGVRGEFDGFSLGGSERAVRGVEHVPVAWGGDYDRLPALGVWTEAGPQTLPQGRGLRPSGADQLYPPPARPDQGA